MAVATMTAGAASLIAAGGAIAADPADSSSILAMQENTPYNGQFIFARLRYDMGRAGGLGNFGRRGGGGNMPPWMHDYPDAEYHLMTLMRELTTLEPGSQTGNIIDIGDPQLHEYPIAYMSEPGYWSMTEREVANMRSYVLKGGFLIFDDFAPQQWNNFERQMQRILPGLQPRQLDASHPAFQAFFAIESLERVYQSYMGQPLFYGYFEDNDTSKRMVAIANYMNDLGENWESPSTGFSFVDAENEAFKFGINYIIYGMTH